KAVRTAATKLRATLPEAHALGDIEALDRRLAAVLEACEKRFAAQAEQRAAAAAAAADRKRALVEEAERLAATSGWREAGRAVRDVDDELWAKFKAAQDAFFARRAESLSARDAELRGNAEAKEALLAEAEQIDPTRDLEGARKRLRSIHDRWEKIGRVP